MRDSHSILKRSSSRFHTVAMALGLITASGLLAGCSQESKKSPPPPDTSRSDSPTHPGAGQEAESSLSKAPFQDLIFESVRDCRSGRGPTYLVSDPVEVEPGRYQQLRLLITRAFHQSSAVAVDLWLEAVVQTRDQAGRLQSSRAGTFRGLTWAGTDTSKPVIHAFLGHELRRDPSHPDRLEFPAMDARKAALLAAPEILLRDLTLKPASESARQESIRDTCEARRLLGELSAHSSTPLETFEPSRTTAVRAFQAEQIRLVKDGKPSVQDLKLLLSPDGQFSLIGLAKDEGLKTAADGEFLILPVKGSLANRETYWDLTGLGRIRMNEGQAHLELTADGLLAVDKSGETVTLKPEAPIALSEGTASVLEIEVITNIVRDRLKTDFE